jgi:hypothetical protein
MEGIGITMSKKYNHLQVSPFSFFFKYCIHKISLFDPLSERLMHVSEAT